MIIGVLFMIIGNAIQIANYKWMKDFIDNNPATDFNIKLVKLTTNTLFVCFAILMLTGALLF